MKKSKAAIPGPKKAKVASATTEKTSSKRVKSSSATAKKTSAKVAPRRADFGAPIDEFFEKRTGELRLIVDALREIIREVAPNADASIKWGMPFYTLNGETLCAIAAFKAHVNLILPGGPGTFSDPDGLLEGEGKTGQHLKVRSRKDLPDKSVRAWLKVAAKNARAKASE